MWQSCLALEDVRTPVFPSTRYQGSKVKFLQWIWSIVGSIDFDTALDAFGGTGCFAYQCKLNGKNIVYNDILPFNAMIGKAIIENRDVTLTNDDVRFILSHEENFFSRFITNTFKDIYYTDEENLWLDRTISNIRLLDNQYKRALAYFALFQSCICKRPYNLFHRKNLYVRLNQVARSFGNKKTWDTPFETHFVKFVKEVNDAVFDNGKICASSCMDALQTSRHYDLVYIDTPYINSAGQGLDYAAFYHFLNGIVDYENWEQKIDWTSKHRKLLTASSVWTDKNQIQEAFQKLFAHFSDSILVVSYRDNGIPLVDEIAELLKQTHSGVSVYRSASMKYTLSTTSSKEVLFVAKP